MPDRYLPALANFAFSADEKFIVAEAIKTAAPWDYVPTTKAGKVALRSAKAKILQYHLQRHKGTCCYCRTNLHGAGPFMTDREHILPKSGGVYKSLTFAIWNLAAACKRCNIQFKKANDDFVVNKTDLDAFQTSDNYLLVHPNFDCWEEHLNRVAVQVNSDTNIVFYTCKPDCPKAAYTYKFFALRDLEVRTFDEAQGLSGRSWATDALMELQKLTSKFEQ